jgi:plasmid stabilization system protein ParE
VIVFADEALTDLERIFEFNLERDPATALDHIARIRSAVMILEDHPEIGRRIAPRSPLRELIVSHGKSGYLALYEYSKVEGVVRILCVRHQREAGYRDISY